MDTLKSISWKIVSPLIAMAALLAVVFVRRQHGPNICGACGGRLVKSGWYDQLTCTNEQCPDKRWRQEANRLHQATNIKSMNGRGPDYERYRDATTNEERSEPAPEDEEAGPGRPTQ